MLFVVDPILPMVTATDWLVTQADQHRRPVAPTAGIAEAQPSEMGWLSPLMVAVEWLIEAVRQFVEAFPSPMSMITRWIVRRFVVHDERLLAIFATKPEVTLPKCRFWLRVSAPLPEVD